MPGEYEGTNRSRDYLIPITGTQCLNCCCGDFLLFSGTVTEVALQRTENKVANTGYFKVEVEIDPRGYRSPGQTSQTATASARE